MPPDPRVIAVSQRVVEVPGYGELRDCLDQGWSAWVQSLGGMILPVPNCCESIVGFLETLHPAGIILSGGNNISLNVYDGVDCGTLVKDAHESRDRTERELIEFAIRMNIPLLGCCRGMQFLQAYFGGRLVALKHSPVDHVGNEHKVEIVQEHFLRLAGEPSLIVNSFHEFGIGREALADPLVPFALSTGDCMVEGFFHRDFPITGIMWHPERPNPANSFDRKLATSVFRSLSCVI